MKTNDKNMGKIRQRNNPSYFLITNIIILSISSLFIYFRIILKLSKKGEKGEVVYIFLLPAYPN